MSLNSIILIFLLFYVSKGLVVYSVALSRARTAICLTLGHRFRSLRLGGGSISRPKSARVTAFHLNFSFGVGACTIWKDQCWIGSQQWLSRLGDDDHSWPVKRSLPQSRPLRATGQNLSYSILVDTKVYMLHRWPKIFDPRENHRGISCHWSS